MAQFWWQVDQFPEYARKFHEEIKMAGSETISFMTWQYEADTAPSFEQIAEVYGKTGAQLGVKVAPVGLAFQRSLRERPELNLLDGARPNQPGFYLTLCVLYATIFDQSPVGLPYRMQGIEKGSDVWFAFDLGTRDEKDWPMGEEDATFLQQVARETVQDYQAGK